MKLQILIQSFKKDLEWTVIANIEYKYQFISIMEAEKIQYAKFSIKQKILSAKSSPSRSLPLSPKQIHTPSLIIFRNMSQSEFLKSLNREIKKENQIFTNIKKKIQSSKELKMKKKKAKNSFDYTSYFLTSKVYSAKLKKKKALIKNTEDQYPKQEVLQNNKLQQTVTRRPKTSNLNKFEEVDTKKDNNFFSTEYNLSQTIKKKRNIHRSQNLIGKTYNEQLHKWVQVNQKEKNASQFMKMEITGTLPCWNSFQSYRKINLIKNNSNNYLI